MQVTHIPMDVLMKLGVANWDASNDNEKSSSLKNTDLKAPQKKYVTYVFNMFG